MCSGDAGHAVCQGKCMPSAAGALPVCRGAISPLAPCTREFLAEGLGADQEEED